ncbi:hypothetical protein Alg215_12008, partial [Pyrenophora tritici-repentis]
HQAERADSPVSANPSEPSELLASAQLAEQANWLSSLSLLIDICGICKLWSYFVTRWKFAGMNGENWHSIGKQLHIYKTIEELNNEEALWMGAALRILRPELLDRMPAKASKLLDGSSWDFDDVRLRNSHEYYKKPLEFLA